MKDFARSISISLPGQLIEDLDELTQGGRVPRSVIIREALEHYVKTVARREGKPKKGRTEPKASLKGQGR